MGKKEQNLIYKPVAGLTVLKAFTEVVEMAQQSGRSVHAIVNDIELDISPKMRAVQAVAVFQKKLEARYAAEDRMAKAKRKKTSGKIEVPSNKKSPKEWGNKWRD